MKNNFPVTQMLFVSTLPAVLCENIDTTTFLSQQLQQGDLLSGSILAGYKTFHFRGGKKNPLTNKMHGTREAAQPFLPACSRALLTDCLWWLRQTNKSSKASRLRNCQIRLKAKLKKENAVSEYRVKVTVIQHISTDCSFNILTFD